MNAFVFRMHRARLVLLSCLAAAPLAAGSFTPGNLLVTFDGDVLETTPAGALVQTIAVPANGSKAVRDLVLADDGRVHVYNGTFSPELATRDGGVWGDSSFAGWSTVNNVSYGGIAEVAGLVFVTDMATAGAGAPRGIVRFDADGGFSASRFADTRDYIDLTLGLDCLLYALRSNEVTVDVFDPIDLSPQGTITLATGVRGVAVTEDGEIFGASWDDNLYHFDAGGTQVDSIASGTTDLTDIDVSRDGRVVAGARFGTVITSTTALDSVSSFTLGVTGTTFVAHVGDASCVLGLFDDGFESGDTSAWTATTGGVP